MIKRLKILSLILLLVFFANGFGATSLIDMIKEMTEDNLKGYTQPLITSFGVATGSGLYHTAATHGLLGFDIGLKGMWVPIPESAKTFVAKVMVLSLNDTAFIEETTATLFGKKGRDSISIPTNSFAIPPSFPGGVNIPGIPFLVPQLSVGLIKGTEIMLRYIPTITYYYSSGSSSADIQIFGAGLKVGLNEFLNLKLFPVDVAVQGAYQAFNIGDIVKSTTISANIQASKTLLLVTPYVGLGYEKTKMEFDYKFKYQIPGQAQPTEVPINVTLNGENQFRAVFGLSLKLGLILIHGDYNLTKYPCFNGGIGVSLR